MAGKRNQAAAKEVESRESENTRIWLAALEDVEEKLSQWEQDFVGSVSDWYYSGKPLTERQYNTLKGLYEKHY